MTTHVPIQPTDDEMAQARQMLEQAGGDPASFIAGWLISLVSRLARTGELVLDGYDIALIAAYDEHVGVTR